MRYFVYCRKSTEAEDRQVASIGSQRAEILRAFGDNPAITIINHYDEAYSAKAPGRRLFDEMMDSLERGEADGIIAWHPDRLARNSVDAGKIVWFLDRRILKDLKFVTYTFENNPQGKFMLSIFLGQSKYYVDSLSENVKRGFRAQLEKGWRPNQAPIGYLNSRETRTIVIDPERFALVRKMFDLILSGTSSPRRIYELARDDWALRTIKHRKLGGKPVSLSAVYKILSNPFYAGLIAWNGRIYEGKHPPMVTFAEFEAVQMRLRGRHHARPQKKAFPFTGMIRCGGCGLYVTAEDKMNRYGSKYTYYHCTRRNLTQPRCTQPSVQAAELERQIIEFLRTITISDSHHRWALRQLSSVAKKREAEASVRATSREKRLAEVKRQLDTLTDLRLRDLLTEEEFTKKRGELQREELRLRDRLVSQSLADTFEPAANFVSFSNRALDWFQAGNDASKRLIFEIVGSNPTLTNKMLSIEARKPFTRFTGIVDFLRLRGWLQDVRTSMNTDDEEFHDRYAKMRLLLDERWPRIPEKKKTIPVSPRAAAARELRRALRGGERSQTPPPL